MAGHVFDGGTASHLVKVFIVPGHPVDALAITGPSGFRQAEMGSGQASVGRAVTGQP